MAFNNFTVSVVSFNETAGVDWTIAQPSVSLLITPATGYTVTAANFSPITPLPTYVNSVVFTQNGVNIDCVITYIAPSIMPSANVLIELCIQGIAIERQICVAGVVSQCDVSNTKLPLAGAADVPYTACGIIGSTSTVVASYQVTAETTYYYPTAPTLAVVIGNSSNYTITDVKTYDASGNLIDVVFTVTYTFPLNDVTGDKLCLTANAVQIYNPPVKITSYSFPTGNTLSYTGQTTDFTINGIEGANWALNIVSNALATIINTSGTLDSTGTFVVPVTFPAAIANATYTVTLTGDLASTFCTVAPYVPCSTGQPSVFTLEQYVGNTLGFNFSSTSSDITIGAIQNILFTPLDDISAPYTYNIIAYSDDNVSFNPTPANSNWPNQGSVVAGDFNFSVVSGSYAIDNSTTPSTITAALTVDVDAVGNTNTTSILNLDNYLEVQGCWEVVPLTAACANGSPNVFISDAQGYSGTTPSVLGNFVSSYSQGDIIKYKNGATGTQYCGTILSFAAGQNPVDGFIDEGVVVNGSVDSPFTTCQDCLNNLQ